MVEGVSPGVGGVMSGWSPLAAGGGQQFALFCTRCGLRRRRRMAAAGVEKRNSALAAPGDKRPADGPPVVDEEDVLSIQPL